MSDQQVSLPFVLILLVTIGLATRYFFSSPPPAPAGARGAREATRRREAAADRVLQMFPQADRRAVLWDLARNGGSVQATTERMLAGRLETVSFAGALFLFLLSGVAWDSRSRGGCETLMLPRHGIVKDFY